MAPKRELFFMVLSILTIQIHSQNAYDYFWFVQQWPPAVCAGRRGCTQPNLQMFTIHGLWPQNYTDPSPTYCGGTTSQPPTINGTLEMNLNTYWPDVINGKNRKFWLYEWNKHGTCSSGVFGYVAYFSIYVQKSKQYDLKNTLAVANIRPSGNWTLLQVRSAIQTMTSKQPIIRCDTSTRSRLIEIVLCYNKAGTRIIDCTSPDSCNANVQW